MLNKKHYEAISRIDQLSKGVDGRQLVAPMELAERLAEYFAGENPWFDAERFIAACQKELTDGSA